MSEIALTVIKVLFLALLWLFILSAVSVIRSDLFGRTVTTPDHGPQELEQPAPAVAQGPAPARGAARADHHPGRQAGESAELRRPGGHDRARRRLPADPRRRLRLHPARPRRSHGRGRRLRRGPRLDQRHLRQQPADHRPTTIGFADTRPHRQDDPEAGRDLRHDPRSSSIATPLRDRPGPQEQPGLRLRQPAPARRRRRHGRRRRRRPGLRGRGRHHLPSTSSTTGRRCSTCWPARSHRANDRIADLVEADVSLDGMGTTVTGALFDGAELGLAHIGDSRAYLLRDGRLQRLTHDHSWVQSLVDEGKISEAEAAVAPAPLAAAQGAQRPAGATTRTCRSRLAPATGCCSAATGCAGWSTTPRSPQLLAPARPGRGAGRAGRGRSARGRHRQHHRASSPTWSTPGTAAAATRPTSWPRRAAGPPCSARRGPSGAARTRAAGGPEEHEDTVVTRRVGPSGRRGTGHRSAAAAAAAGPGAGRTRPATTRCRRRDGGFVRPLVAVVLVLVVVAAGLGAAYAWTRTPVLRRRRRRAGRHLPAASPKGCRASRCPASTRSSRSR